MMVKVLQYWTGLERWFIHETERRTYWWAPGCNMSAIELRKSRSVKRQEILRGSAILRWCARIKWVGFSQYLHRKDTKRKAWLLSLMTDKERQMKENWTSFVHVSPSNGVTTSWNADLDTAISHIQCMRRIFVHAEAIPCNEALNSIFWGSASEYAFPFCKPVA